VNLLSYLSTFLFNCFGYTRCELQEHVRFSLEPNESIKRTLSCSPTASTTHLTLASRARTSTAAWADALDAVCARVHRCSPICNAFLDWRTRETKCGWVEILGLGIRVDAGPGVGGVVAVVGGACTLLWRDDMTAHSRDKLKRCQNAHVILSLFLS